jgi:hypothetical protein
MHIFGPLGLGRRGEIFVDSLRGTGGLVSYDGIVDPPGCEKDSDDLGGCASHALALRNTSTGVEDGEIFSPLVNTGVPFQLTTLIRIRIFTRRQMAVLPDAWIQSTI